MNQTAKNGGQTHLDLLFATLPIEMFPSQFVFALPQLLEIVVGRHFLLFEFQFANEALLFIIVLDVVVVFLITTTTNNENKTFH